jgi:hypothetical protein
MAQINLLAAASCVTAVSSCWLGEHHRWVGLKSDVGTALVLHGLIKSVVRRLKATTCQVHSSWPLKATAERMPGSSILRVVRGLGQQAMSPGSPAPGLGREQFGPVLGVPCRETTRSEERSPGAGRPAICGIGTSSLPPSYHISIP